MKQSKDPFEAAFVEQEDSPPSSPVPPSGELPPSAAVRGGGPPPDEDDYDDYLDSTDVPSTSAIATAATTSSAAAATHSNVVSSSAAKNKNNNAHANQNNADNDEDEEEDNMDVELGKFPSSGDPTKMAKMQAILSQFTEGQMSRYESFRRSVFQKSNMKKLLMNAAGTQKISLPMTIVVSGIAKMFVGELVETARMVMKERKDSGPIRPCHIREAYRRLKLEGKVPKRSVPRLFR